MIPLLHVLLEASAVAAAGVLIWRKGRRPDWKRAVAAVALLAVPACSALSSVHKCDSGQPISQWLVPSLALLAVVLFVEPLKWVVASGMVLTLAAFALSLHYAEVVHGPIWVGNPDSFTLDGERAAREWHTPVTGLFRRVR